MVQTQVLSHLYLNAGHVHTIDVPRVPLPRWVAIFVRLMNQTNRNSAIHSCNRSIAVSQVRYAIHDDVDLLRLGIEALLCTREKVLAPVRGGWKIQVRINWEGWIFAR